MLPLLLSLPADDFRFSMYADICCHYAAMPPPLITPCWRAADISPLIYSPL